MGDCNVAIGPMKVLFRLYDNRLFVTYDREVVVTNLHGDFRTKRKVPQCTSGIYCSLTGDVKTEAFGLKENTELVRSALTTSYPGHSGSLAKGLRSRSTRDWTSECTRLAMIGQQ